VARCEELEALPSGSPFNLRPISRPFGTYCSAGLVPNVETLGYSRMSLRDMVLAQLHECFLRSSPSGIGQECPRS
jgi:hypothetical protein